MLGENKSCDTVVQAYTGIPIGCTFCAYESSRRAGPIPLIPRATKVILTANGRREVCDVHARKGRP